MKTNMSMDTMNFHTYEDDYEINLLEARLFINMANASFFIIKS